MQHGDKIQHVGDITQISRDEVCAFSCSCYWTLRLSIFLSIFLLCSLFHGSLVLFLFPT